VRLIAAMIISLVIFLGIGTYSEIWLSNTAQEISLEVAYLEENIRSHNWEKSTKLIDDIHSRWASVSDRWDIMVNHSEIDQVSLSLVRAAKFIETENFDLALAEVAVIHHLILHIAENESLRILNIF